MVVLSSGVVTKGGKPLFSRQFVPMSRIRSESLLGAFPKLVGTGSQHTFIETEDVRYLYQPIEELYLLVITNKQSNIMEDLETLRLLAKLIPDYASGYTEEQIMSSVFELIFAFDEVISCGHKENVTVQQVRTFTDMDSHEETLQKMIMESKMNEAREEARRKSALIDKRKADERRQEKALSQYGLSSASTGSNSYSSSNSSGPSSNSYDYEAAPEPEPVYKAPSKPKANKKRSKGMTLSKAKKDDFLTQLHKEEGSAMPVAGPIGGGRKNKNKGAGGRAAAPVNQSFDCANVLVEEKLVLQMDREGGIKKLALSGEMKLTVFDPDDAKIVIHTNGPIKGGGFKTRLHPKVDKKAYNKTGALGLSDPKRAFPIGSDNAPIILKWRMTTTEESEVPFTLNFWPSSEDGNSVVSVEYSTERAGLVLKDVEISVPTGGQRPEVQTCDGEFRYEDSEGSLVWMIEEISEDSESGSLEFSIPEQDEEEFFPININFTSPNTYTGIEITGVTHSESGEKKKCDTVVRLQSEEFIILQE